MEWSQVLASMDALFRVYGGWLNAWLLIFARVLAFVQFAPVINRKDIPFNIKLSLALYLTSLLVWVVPHPGSALNPQGLELGIMLFMNVLVGALIGFIADLVLQTVYSAGDLMNNQIGLSSAMMFDPGARKQIALLGTLFVFIGGMVFLELGGLYWLIENLQRSFETFPLQALSHDIPGKIALDYLVMLAGNTLTVGVILVAPVMIVTLAVDIMLGVINRTAQQIPVFQLSFALKPVIGLIVFLTTLPLFIESVAHYLKDFQRFF
jgi:flagellar biosynthetic protein FliR